MLNRSTESKRLSVGGKWKELYLRSQMCFTTNIPKEEGVLAGGKWISKGIFDGKNSSSKDMMGRKFLTLLVHEEFSGVVGADRPRGQCQVSSWWLQILSSGQGSCYC